jgi:uncharacterized membrane protein YccC
VKLWKWEPENLPSLVHSIRTAIAATLSFAVARLFGLPEAYWAAIVALHRFIEISVGIIVALAFVGVWPEHQRESATQTVE